MQYITTSVLNVLDSEVIGANSLHNMTSSDTENGKQDDYGDMTGQLDGESDPGGYDDDMLFGGLGTKDFLPPELPANVRFAFTVLYIVIITLGLTGNVTTVLVIGLSREMRTVTNVFLVSLAISDGLIASLNMPVYILAYCLLKICMLSCQSLVKVRVPH